MRKENNYESEEINDVYKEKFLSNEEINFIKKEIDASFRAKPAKCV